MMNSSVGPDASLPVGGRLDDKATAAAANVAVVVVAAAARRAEFILVAYLLGGLAYGLPPIQYLR